MLNNGANPNASDAQGVSALEYASWKGHTEIVRILLDAGADVAHVDLFGMTAIHKAVGYRHHKVVKILIDDGGADPNQLQAEVRFFKVV